MLIKQDITIFRLKDLITDCDDFWKVVEKQNLWARLENYLIDCVDPNDIPDLGHIRDVFRFEGDIVLKAIGAKFGGTIWEDIYGCD